MSADALSRNKIVQLPANIKLPELIKMQKNDVELVELLRSPRCSLYLKLIECGHNMTKIFCDLTSKIQRPYISKSLRRQIFYHFYSHSYPGPKVFDQLV